jgi:hypothetical protein
MSNLDDALPIEGLDDEDSVMSNTSNEGFDEPIELEHDENPSQASQIVTFGKQKRHAEKWQRSPNVTGAGAIHVRTFFAKLREDALEYMDEQINEWLDQHPEYEVKFVTTAVGELKGKLTEPAMFVSVWV